MTYIICSRCVMDTSDSAITFDDQGVCDHCHGFDADVVPNWHPNAYGDDQLRQLVDQIRKVGRGQEFDSIIGMSGGLDSSYLLHSMVTKYSLRPLVFHVDGGWNTDLAVENIQNIVDKLNLELFTEVINWDEMRDFQLSFFKSGVPYIDLPQDHAFIAALYKYAAKNNIKYILNGGNFSTECVRNPLNWGWFGTDMINIRDIHSKFGSVELKSFPFSGVLYHKIYLHYIRRIKVVKPLNLMAYSKKIAEETLRAEYGWRPYPQKHFESRFTKFFEGYWLPTRFGFDTRRTQFSSLILTGQMTRAEALEKLSTPAYHSFDIEAEFEYIADKLGVSAEELRRYHEMPLMSYKDYKNQESLFKLGSLFFRLFRREGSVKR
jgi:N-acetyl sugar amidotransferase